jgi:hypothetical protein
VSESGNAKQTPGACTSRKKKREEKCKKDEKNEKNQTKEMKEKGQLSDVPLSER